MRLASILILVLLSGCQGKPDPRLAAIVHLGIGVTPGKPMELCKPGLHAESIRAFKGEAGPQLEVFRNVGSSVEQFQSKTVTLSEAEWASLIALVAKHTLLDAVVAETGSDVADYGARAFEFQLEGQTMSELTMIRPPVVAGFAELQAKLKALADAKVPEVKLFYMG